MSQAASSIRSTTRDCLQIICTLLALTGALTACGGEADVPATPAERSVPETIVAFGYEAYDELLHTYVDENGGVDYAGLHSNRGDLDAFILSFQTLRADDLDSWSSSDQVAFWINAYNAITLQRILDHYPIEKGGLISGIRYPANSIRQIPGVWTKLETPMIGKTLTLDAIEHEILRVDFTEPRIHTAIVCAAVSCPPLRAEAFRGDRLEAQLADQSRRFLAGATGLRIDHRKKRVEVSSIFDWFGEDFVGVYNIDSTITGQGTEKGAVLEFVSRHVNDTDAQFLRTEDYSVAYLDYDWSLNEQ